MKINFRKARLEDVNVYYHWATDELVRENSYVQGEISLEKHIAWFKSKISSSDCFLYFFTDNQIPVVQVRIEKKASEFVIGISIDPKYRGKGLGSIMLNKACADFFFKFLQLRIVAYIKTNNTPSYRIFKKANFIGDQPILVDGVESIKLYKIKS